MFGIFGRKDKSTDGPTTLVIKSDDIDKTRFSESHIIKMRERYAGLNDDILARYLIARNDDYAKACEQLERALQWKAQHFPILKTSCLKEINSGKLYIRGVDKEGRPLLIFRSCCSFPKDRDLEESARMLVWFAEHLQRRMPPNMSKYTLLIDRTGHKSENTDMDLVKHVSAQFQVRYYSVYCRTHCCCFVWIMLWHCCFVLNHHLTSPAGSVPRDFDARHHLPLRRGVLLDLGDREVVRGPRDP